MKIMKTRIYLGIIILLMAFFSSCVTSYYQVYKASSGENISLMDNKLVYEDENCKVFYNLWSEGGNIGFKFFNKTNKNIYLNMEESFFILNGTSNNYYKNRIFTRSNTLGTSVSNSRNAGKSMTGINNLNLIQTNSISATNYSELIASHGYAVSFNEEKIICIPSLTAKNIAEYNITNSLFRDCDLFKYPSRNQIKTKSFNKDNSPLTFSNQLIYSVDKSGQPVKVKNDFFVSEITNYPETEILESVIEEYCEQKSLSRNNYIKDIAPNKFYIHYLKEKSDIWKH